MHKNETSFYSIKIIIEKRLRQILDNLFASLRSTQVCGARTRLKTSQIPFTIESHVSSCY